MAAWKHTDLIRPDWRNIVKGVVAGVITAVLLAAFAALLMCKGAVDVQWTTYIATAIMIMAGVVGAAIKAHSIADTIGIAVGLWLMLLCVNALFYDFEIDGAWLGLLPLVGGAGAGILLKNSGGTQRKRRRSKYRHR